jgi:hypothetical protein
MLMTVGYLHLVSVYYREFYMIQKVDFEWQTAMCEYKIAQKYVTWRLIFVPLFHS